MTASREGSHSLVLTTYNRRDEVVRTLERTLALEEHGPLVVVDNASTDGTADVIRRRWPQVTVHRLDRNQGAAARNEGARLTRSPYIAFCDDDCWWAAGALLRAAAVLDRFPGLAAVNARVLVEPGAREDPTNARMAGSPLPNPDGVPGSIVLGLMGGACMVRREAFVQAGGYDPRLFLGSEELLLAIDLAALGWSMAYLPEAVVHHHPSAARDRAGREVLLVRNRLWCAWLRRPAAIAVRETARALRAAAGRPRLVFAVVDALRGAGWVLRERVVVADRVEAALRLVEALDGHDPRW